MKENYTKYILQNYTKYILQLIPETQKHLQPLNYNPIPQLNLSQAHQHIDVGHFFSWLFFLVAQAETRTNQFIRIQVCTKKLEKKKNPRLVEVNTNPKAKNIYIPHNHMTHVGTLNFHSDIRSINRSCTVDLNVMHTTKESIFNINFLMIRQSYKYMHIGRLCSARTFIQTINSMLLRIACFVSLWLKMLLCNCMIIYSNIKYRLFKDPPGQKMQLQQVPQRCS